MTTTAAPSSEPSEDKPSSGGTAPPEDKVTTEIKVPIEGRVSSGAPAATGKKTAPQDPRVSRSLPVSENLPVSDDWPVSGDLPTSKLVLPVSGDLPTAKLMLPVSEDRPTSKLMPPTKRASAAAPEAASKRTAPFDGPARAEPVPLVGKKADQTLSKPAATAGPTARPKAAAEPEATDRKAAKSKAAETKAAKAAKAADRTPVHAGGPSGGAAGELGVKGGEEAPDKGKPEFPLPPAPLVLETPQRGRAGRHRRRGSKWRTLVFILWRDVFVTGRELGPFLGQVLVEPFFILFVFGKVLGELGYTQPGFDQVLLPGVVALNSFLVSLQNTALPLAIDFSWTKEIEDRLLAPTPTVLVAIEKVIFGAMRGLIGSLVMIPIGLGLLDNASWPLAIMPQTLGILALGGLVGGCVGLTLGTLTPARHISIVFAMTLTPIMFTGATQFPWQSLTDIRWFQIMCAFNPLTYVSEAMRGILMPTGGPESIPLPICLGAIGVACLVYGAIGIRGFHRRAQD